VLLHLATWQEVEIYLEHSQTLIIPIGSTEQHGPNGFIGTDALCPEIIAKQASTNTSMLIGPTFNVGSAQHHLGFAGSITLRPSTMISVMLDWVNSLERHGFERVYWLNGHGGNAATIEAAFAEIYAQRSFSRHRPNKDLRLKLMNWWNLPGVGKFCAKLFPVGEGSHATASEVAVTYSAFPDFVKHVDMTPRIAPAGKFRDAEDFRTRYPDGRIGSDPSQATPERGEQIVHVAAKSLIDDFRLFADEA